MRTLRFLFLLALLATAAAARGGVLTREDVARRFPAPIIVGVKESGVPAWPLFKQNGTATELVGYVFESIDLAPVPGFTGVPPNLLVAIDPKGGFIEVAVLSQHEPVFMEGLGEAPLREFVAQYKGASLGQNIDVGGPVGAGRVRLDGVSKATASVRIVNQSVLSAALRVARAKLGFAQGREPGGIARIDHALFEAMDLDALRRTGMIAHLRVLNRDVEKLFAGSDGAGLDQDALARPDEVFIDLYLAWASVPAIGRNLLDAAGWERLQGRLDSGDHALLVMSAGRHGILAEDFVRGSVPQRIALRQDGLPVEMRDLDLDLRLKVALPVTEVLALRVIGQAGLDPARPLGFSLPVTRSKGIVYPERITRELQLAYRLPAHLYQAPEPPASAWRASWSSRLPDLLVLAGALALLATALALPQRLVKDRRRFAWIRSAWLLFTVGFIGYHAQAQLSIVNLTGVVQALHAGRGLDFLLFDPMSLALWVFVLLSLLPWGRGTFCGWLCPFGALQELMGQLGRALRLPQLVVRRALDARLRRIKFLVLAAVMAAAWFAPALADRLVEVEPFKTAITLAFDRAWPFVAWAAVLLALAMVSTKFFCRYLCPLGAALALAGRVRMLDWIRRRAECGTPCQTCRHRCAYGAIRPDGKIDYGECFQCMDCVAIIESDSLCAPRILEKKRGRTVVMMQVAAK